MKILLFLLLILFICLSPIFIVLSPRGEKAHKKDNRKQPKIDTQILYSILAEKTRRIFTGNFSLFVNETTFRLSLSPSIHLFIQ